MDNEKMTTIAFIIACLLFTMISALQAEKNGELFFQRYCGNCHGERDRRSGSIVFHSKRTIISRYKNRSKQLIHKLNNIDKYSISNIMVQAVHKIEDKQVLILIVNHISNPDLPLPEKTKDNDVLIKDL